MNTMLKCPENKLVTSFWQDREGLDKLLPLWNGSNRGCVAYKDLYLHAGKEVNLEYVMDPFVARGFKRVMDEEAYGSEDFKVFTMYHVLYLGKQSSGHMFCIPHLFKDTVIFECDASNYYQSWRVKKI